MGRRPGWRWLWLALGGVLAVAAALTVASLQGVSNPQGSDPLAPPPVEGAGVLPAGDQTGEGAGARTYVVVASESVARYRVGETFFQFNRQVEAVGVTGSVSGEFSLGDAPSPVPVSGEIRADISQLTSDEPRRDQAIRGRWLESARYPIATFHPTALELPASLEEGLELPVTVRGELTVREVTRPTVWTGTLILQGETLRAALSTRIRMTDYGFDPPSILGMLRAEDEATLEVELVARRSEG